MSEQETGGSVTYGAGILTCVAPPGAAMRVDFYDSANCCTGSEVVSPGDTRVIAPLGVSFRVATVAPVAVLRFPVQVHQDWPEGCRCVTVGKVGTALGGGPCPLHEGEWPI